MPRVGESGRLVGIIRGTWLKVESFDLDAMQQIDADLGAVVDAFEQDLKRVPYDPAAQGAAAVRRDDYERRREAE